ncbi:MAG: signal peptidase I [Fimbriimonadaceae bacterium]|nr:signal peptidase I [Fimbriimonadaceae bacterium]
MLGYGITPLTALIACAILTGLRLAMRGRRFESASKALARICALTMVVFGIVQPFVIQVYFVPSRSMSPTLLPGDFLVGLKRPTRLEQGDIVVFRSKKGGASDFVKRIVAVPGEVVEIKNGRIVVNGRTLDEPYILEPWTGEVKWIRYDGRERPDWKDQIIPVHVSGATVNWNTDVAPQYAIGRQSDGSFLPLDRLSPTEQRLMSELQSAPPAPLPPNTYLVLGDNRHGSRDSRDWGVIRKEEIAAKGVAILFPFARAGTLKRNSLPP